MRARAHVGTRRCRGTSVVGCTHRRVSGERVVESSTDGIFAKDLILFNAAAGAFMGRTREDMAGAEVVIAENGAIAVARAVMDGMEATGHIRALLRHAHTPILALTANAFGEDRAACIAAGMDDHVPKPVDPPVLLAAVERWIHAPAEA